MTDKGKKLLAWFAGWIERAEALESELVPYRRRARRGEQFTGRERAALAKLLDRQELLSAEQADKMSNPLLLSMVKTQRATLRQLVEVKR